MLLHTRTMLASLYTAMPVVLLLLVTSARTQDNESTTNAQDFRPLFIRIPNQRLASVSAKNITGSDVEACAESCVKETEFECLSFDFINVRKQCRLHTRSLPRARKITQAGTDHYKTAYEKLFQRIPNHVVTLTHTRKIALVTIEECARVCYLEMQFYCRGFDYETESKVCWLTDKDSQLAGGARIYSGADYYERIPDGPLSKFINYGFGTLRPLVESQLYSKVQNGIELAECARQCLEEASFHCLSIDYYFSSSSCHMSRYIAANVYGMITSHNNGVRVMHYELKEKYLQYFYSTPYSVILGNNHKTYTRVTPNRCARMCMMEESFICRSFDYQIREGTCLLSIKTGSDVGGLFNQELAQIHHFEMKPILNCGGNLTSEEGDFASPNWPRQYAPHEQCSWSVRVERFKVIRFNFIRFDLGMQSSNACDDSNDKLIYIERTSGGYHTPRCLRSSNKRLLSETNEVTMTFVTNGQDDAAGFRVFYASEWPCAATLTENKGEFASPEWPDNYPPGSKCNWNVKAPYNHKIILTFTHFELQEPANGECNTISDQVIIYDGEQDTSSNIGIYCGTQVVPFHLESTGNNLKVIFNSDLQEHKSGFHATYSFEELPHISTTISTTTGVISTKPIFTSRTPDIRTTLGFNLLLTTSHPGELNKNITTEKTLFDDKDGAGKRHIFDKATENTSKRGFETTIWVVATVLTVMIIVVAIGIIIVCKYRRKTARKRCSQKNLTSHAETTSLCNQPSITPTESSVPTTPIKTFFSNPLYCKGKRKSGMESVC